MRFKRNQVEEAISRLLQRKGARGQLETRIKRLYETDRKLGRSPRANDADRANYGFFSAEAPGSGVEVWFSEYEAFALLTALRLLEHGLPQKTAVLILRRARPQLEPKHAEIMTWDPKSIFDERKIRARWQPGMAYLPTTRPVFLAVGGLQKPRKKPSSEVGQEIHIIEKRDLLPYLLSETGKSATLFELSKAAHDMRAALTSTTPSKRGRGSS
jgi:hypothetical protein